LLNFNQLRAFYYAAKSLNFTIAAKNLFVSQPAVTAQIKLFEQSCKLDLFKKKGRRIYLTDEGKTIFRYASKIFELEQDLEKTIYDLKKIRQGCLRIGTTKTYAMYLMPVVLAPFHKSFPGITIELNEGSSLEMSNSLLDFRRLSSQQRYKPLNRVLSTRLYRIEGIPYRIIKGYLGGRGLGTYLLYKLGSVKVYPSGEANYLIFTEGPTNGTGFPKCI